MTDRFDEAKRALEDVPAHHVWDEARRRAAADELVPLAPVDGRVRRPGRWLAAAAVAAVAVGTLAVIAADDDQPVGTGGSGAGSDPLVDVYQADGACTLGIRGGPLPEPVTVAAAETHVEGTVGTVAHGRLTDTQVFAVQVPGQVVTDLVGERVEEVELHRGAAQLWFRGTASVPASDDTAAWEDAVQVRWFTGSQEACNSFTVDVGGGTEAENRAAAVDLAQRVVLPSELPQPHPSPSKGNPLAGTEWFLQRSTLGGESTTAEATLVFWFRATDAGWDDGCNVHGATYTYADEILRLGDVESTLVGCEPTPTLEAVSGVMVGGGIAAIVEGDVLILRTLDGELTLRRAGRAVDTRTGYGIWPMTAPERLLGYRPEVIGTAEETAAAFAREVLGWEDAEIDPVSGEPPHDGFGVLSVGVRSPSRDRSIGVRVAEADPKVNGHVVYLVGVEGVGDAQVTFEGGGGRVDLEGAPPGTVSTTVRIIFGEYEVEGTIGEELELPSTTSWDGSPIGGAVLVLFRDADDQVIGAWGMAVSNDGTPIR